MKKFTIYGRPGCGYCSAAVNLLKARQLPFEYIDLFQQGMSKQEVEKAIGRPVHTVPQILFGEEYVGGYTELYAYLNQKEVG